MIKKMLVATSSLILALTSGVMAAGMGSFETNVSLDSLYKSQTNYRSAISSLRAGQQHRADQTTRTVGKVQFVGKYGENGTGEDKWYSVIGVSEIKFNVNDPDQTDGHTTAITNGAVTGTWTAGAGCIDSGVSGVACVGTISNSQAPSTATVSKTRGNNDDVYLGNNFIRWAPIRPLGISIGNKTIAATANASTTHIFKGDPDEDFVALGQSSALLYKPGISIDGHLSKEIELGLALIQGAGDGAEIAATDVSLTTGAKTTSIAADMNNTVVYARIKDLGGLSANFAMQSITHGSTKTSGSTAKYTNLTTTEHKYGLSVMNFAAKYKIGPVAPFVGYESISGKNAANVSVAGTVTSVGLEASVAGFDIALEMDAPSTKKFGEKDSILTLTDAGTVTLLNVDKKLNDNATATFFYMSAAGENDKTITDLAATPTTSQAIGVQKAVASAVRFTATSSVGVNLAVNF